MLQQAKDDAKEQQRWRRQRCHGLRLAVLQDLEAKELLALYQRLQSPEDAETLKRLLRLALPVEYRKASSFSRRSFSPLLVSTGAQLHRLHPGLYLFLTP
jgi:hypothetical protein